MMAIAHLVFEAEARFAPPHWLDVLAFWLELAGMPLRRVRAAFGKGVVRGLLTAALALVLIPVWLFCLAVVLLVLPFAFLLPWLVMAFAWLMASNGRGLAFIVGG